MDPTDLIYQISQADQTEVGICEVFAWGGDRSRIHLIDRIYRIYLIDPICPSQSAYFSRISGPVVKSG